MNVSSLKITGEYTLPTSEQVSSIVAKLGLSARKDHILETYHKLAKYKSQHTSNSHYNLLGLSPQQIDHAYASGAINSETFGKLLGQGNAFERSASQNAYESRFESTQKQGYVIEQLFGPGEIQHARNDFTSWIILASYLVSFQKSVLTNLNPERAVEILSILIFSPGFIQSATSNEQEQFFDLFFTYAAKTDLKEELSNNKSELWSYLENCFGNIHALQKHKVKQFPNPLTGLQGFKAEVDTIIKRGIGIEELPSDGEIIDLASFFEQEQRAMGLVGLSKVLEKNRLKANILTKGDINGKSSKDVAIAYLCGNLPKDLLGYDIPVRKNIKGEAEGIPVFHHLLIIGDLDSNSQKRILDHYREIPQDTNANGIPRETNAELELLSLSAGVTLLKFEEDIGEEIYPKGQLLCDNIGLLIHPGFLIHAEKEMQEKFFSIFFTVLSKNSELENKDSQIWQYLLKYFGSVEYLTSKYSERFGNEAFIGIESANRRALSSEERENRNTLNRLLSIFGNPQNIDAAIHFHTHSQTPIDLTAKGNITSIGLKYLGGGFSKSEFKVINVERLEKDSPEDNNKTYFSALLQQVHRSDTQKKLIEKIATACNVNSSGIYGDELKFMVLGVLILRYGENASGGVPEPTKKRAILSLLLYPGYIANASIKEKNKFRTLFLELFNIEDLQDKQLGFFIEYVNAIFGEGNFFLGKRQSENDLFGRTITGTKLTNPESKSVRDYLGDLGQRGRGRTVIPFLAKLRGARQVANNPNGIDFAEYISRDLAAMYVSGGLDPKKYDKSICSGDMYGGSVEDFLLNHRRITDEQRRGFILTNIPKLNSLDEAQLMMFGVTLLKFGPEIVGEFLAKIDILKVFTTLLLDRGYIEVAPEEEKKNFFLYLFSTKNGESLRNHHLKIWEYLLEYFGDEEIVQNEYTRLIETKKAGEDIGSGKQTAEKVLLPEFDNSNIELVRQGERYILEGSVTLYPNAQIVVIVWNKGHKSPTYYSIPEAKNNGIEVGKNQFVEIGYLEEGKSMVIANYKEQKQSFTRLGVPREREERKIVKNTKVRVKTTLKPKAKKHNSDTGNIPLITDSEVLQTGVGMFFDELDIQYKEENKTFTFTLPEGLGVIKDSGYQGGIRSREIIFDISSKPGKLISFFGIKDFKITDDELLELIYDKISAHHKEQKVKEKKEASKKIAKISLPSKYQKSGQKLIASTFGDTIEERGGNTYYLWQLLPKQGLLELITKDMRKAGFEISFERGSKSELSMLNITFNGNKYGFDLGSNYQPEKMFLKDKNTNGFENEAIARHILFHVVGELYYQQVESPNRQSLKNKIKRQENSRKELKKTVKVKLDKGNASFIDNEGWDILEKEKVGWNHPDIDAFPILGRIPYIRVSTENTKNTTRDQEFNFLKRMITEGEIDMIVENFYYRILETTGSISHGHQKINAKAGKLLLKVKNTIIQSTDLEVMKDEVIKTIELFYDSGIFVHLISPVEFSLRELET